MPVRIAKSIKLRRALLAVLAVGILVVIVVSLRFHAFPAWAGSTENSPRSAARECADEEKAQLVPGSTDQFRLPPDVVKKLGVTTAEARPATEPRLLEMQGSLALDTNRLVRAHSRFAGEVIEVAKVPDEGPDRPNGQTVVRPVSFGDFVHKGQLLAVIWCKDLGEKKSELVDGLSQLRVDKEQLDKRLEYYKDGAIPDALIRQAQRAVEADNIVIARAERTLRVWRLTEAEIDAVKEEAKKIRERGGKRDIEKEKDWARVEVCAPFDGVVVEKNVAMGDIVDTTNDLFKIAAMERLTVWANAREEDLPGLLDLPGENRTWTVRVNADPGVVMEGRIDKIGYVSDPTQHTVMIMGHVDNPRGRLRAGQFITTTVKLPPAPGLVTVPASALVEDGRESVVLVQPDPKEPRYTLRPVSVAGRGPKQVLIRSYRMPGEAAGAVDPLQAGERVVTGAALQLRAMLDDLVVAASHE